MPRQDYGMNTFFRLDLIALKLVAAPLLVVTVVAVVEAVVAEADLNALPVNVVASVEAVVVVTEVVVEGVTVGVGVPEEEEEGLVEEAGLEPRRPSTSWSLTDLKEFLLPEEVRRFTSNSNVGS